MRVVLTPVAAILWVAFFSTLGWVFYPYGFLLGPLFLVGVVAATPAQALDMGRRESIWCSVVFAAGTIVVAVACGRAAFADQDGWLWRTAVRASEWWVFPKDGMASVSRLGALTGGTARGWHFAGVHTLIQAAVHALFASYAVLLRLAVWRRPEEITVRDGATLWKASLAFLFLALLEMVGIVFDVIEPTLRTRRWNNIVWCFAHDSGWCVTKDVLAKVFFVWLQFAALAGIGLLLKRNGRQGEPRRP